MTCQKCKSEIVNVIDVCRVCYGSGKSDDPLDLYGCLSCRNGDVIDWECDCVYEDEDE